jgi:hypothetical protein
LDFPRLRVPHEHERDELRATGFDRARVEGVKVEFD